MSFHRGWLSGRYRIFFLLPGDIKKPIINWMISCHPSILHILILILNTATFSYGLQYPTVYLLCGAISWLLGILLLSNYSVHCNPPVDIPTDVSNWYDRSHRHRSNQNLSIEHPPSSHLQPKLTINQWLLICYIANLHASPALYHLLIPHGDMYLFSYVDCCIRNIPMVDCYIRCLYIFHIFQYVRWLLCIILLQSFVTASVLSSHTSSSHMLIVDLLFWYLHLNYKPIFNTHQLFIPIVWNGIALLM